MKRFADAIATCTNPASQRNTRMVRISATFRTLHSPRCSTCRARNCCATSARRNPSISFAQNFHHPRNLRNPQQRPCPPNLTRQRHGRIRPSESASVAQKKLHFSHQVLARQSQQRPHSRILQWGQRHSTPLQNRREPPRDSRAELALRIKEQPTPRMPPLPVRVLTHQRNHRFFSFLLLRVPLRSRCNRVIFFSSLCSPRPL